MSAYEVHNTFFTMVTCPLTTRLIPIFSVAMHFVTTFECISVLVMEIILQLLHV